MWLKLDPQGLSLQHINLEHVSGASLLLLAMAAMVTVSLTAMNPALFNFLSFTDTDFIKFSFHHNLR